MADAVNGEATNDVRNLVRDEVTQAISPTLRAIEEIKALLSRQD